MNKGVFILRNHYLLSPLLQCKLHIKLSKSYIPRERSPEHFSHKLGVSSSIAFHDVLSIDDPDFWHSFIDLHLLWFWFFRHRLSVKSKRLMEKLQRKFTKGVGKLDWLFETVPTPFEQTSMSLVCLSRLLGMLKSLKALKLLKLHTEKSLYRETRKFPIMLKTNQLPLYVFREIAEKSKFVRVRWWSKGSCRTRRFRGERKYHFRKWVEYHSGTCPKRESKL